MKLSDTYKAETARSLTELAIQNGLISKNASPAQTAKYVCDFFKTIIDEIDNSSDPSK